MKLTKRIWIIPLVLIGSLAMITGACEKEEEIDDNGDDPAVEDGTTGTVTDIDGNEYETVYINGKEWMAEDLSTTKYDDGTDIPTGLSDEDWGNAEQGAYAAYPSDLEEADGIDSDSEMIDAYGLLYNWHAVNSEKGLAPEGWRIPTLEEWEGLKEYIENNYGDIPVARALKSCRQVNSPLGGNCVTSEHPRWDEDEDHGTDEFGFSALPAGDRAGYGDYYNLGHMWTAWSATTNDNDAEKAYRVRLRDNSDAFFVGDFDEKVVGFSVRCVKD